MPDVYTSVLTQIHNLERPAKDIRGKDEWITKRARRRKERERGGGASYPADIR